MTTHDGIEFIKNITGVPLDSSKKEVGLGGDVQANSSSQKSSNEPSPSNLYGTPTPPRNGVQG